MDMPTKCVTSKKIKIVSEKALENVTMLETKKDKGVIKNSGSTKETWLTLKSRHSCRTKFDFTRHFMSNRK